MAYWGCSIYPNRFLSSTIKIRKALSGFGVTGNINVTSKTAKAKNSFGISTITPVESQEQIVKAYSSVGVNGVSQRIFARMAYSGESGVTSLGISEPHQNVIAKSEIGVVSTGHMIKLLNRTAASVFVPVAIANDTYYWQSYEAIEDEDNDSEVN